MPESVYGVNTPYTHDSLPVDTRGKAKPGLTSFTALRRMRVPSAAGFRLDVGEAGAGGRVGDADEMLAGRALDLPSGVTRVA